MRTLRYNTAIESTARETSFHVYWCVIDKHQCKSGISDVVLNKPFWERESDNAAAENAERAK